MNAHNDMLLRPVPMKFAQLCVSCTWIGFVLEDLRQRICPEFTICMYVELQTSAVR